MRNQKIIHLNAQLLGIAGIEFNGQTVNGEMSAEGLKADVRASTVNGSVKVTTTGLAEAWQNAVNELATSGRLRQIFARGNLAWQPASAVAGVG